MHVRRGDTVLVLSGKDKGKQGRILRALPKVGKVVVEGVNIVIKHQRPRQGNRAAQIQAGRIEKPAPLFVSKVMLICPRCSKPAKTHRVESEGGRRARACRKCGELIDLKQV
ncbi:MAG: 50S ribosomal protein L24 [Armatimonadetes bacterium]|nr:50S ribosomal protein L24 [Armatimonadota bacterium]